MENKPYWKNSITGHCKYKFLFLSIYIYTYEITYILERIQLLNIEISIINELGKKLGVLCPIITH